MSVMEIAAPPSPLPMTAWGGSAPWAVTDSTTLREELPEGVCALLEDLGADPTAVWDILEKEGWFEC